jgi:hypothetical protein
MAAVPDLAMLHLLRTATGHVPLLATATSHFRLALSFELAVLKLRSSVQGQERLFSVFSYAKGSATARMDRDSDHRRISVFRLVL